MATAVELNEERHDVRGDGRIILYKREGLKNPKWQARIRVPNAHGYKIVTTKTDNLREAERFALDLYEDLYLHVKSGGSVQSKTFKQVFDEWKKHVTALGHTRRGGSWDSTIDRVETYALKFFGPKKVDGIGSSDFAEFWVWRKTNFNRRQPSNGTLRRERTCLLPVFNLLIEAFLRHDAVEPRHQPISAGEADGNLGRNAGKVLRPDGIVRTGSPDHQG